MSASFKPVAPKKVGMISLGCAKNLVDAEVMLGSAVNEGLQVTADADDADVLIINTCAFIDSAKEESIDAILEAHQQRGLRRKEGQKLIVSGCMAQRFSRELSRELPEVDAFIGLDQVADAGRIIRQIAATPVTADSAWEPVNLVTRRPVYIPDYDTPRFRLTPSHTAYVKIGEGCNHPCSFCVIPQMRGRHRSRTIPSVVAEARRLVAEGVREINLISQDTTYFGMDLWEQRPSSMQPIDSARGPTLCGLLEELQGIEGDFWIRLLYTHPAHWSDELIRTISRCDKVARYVDMPLQHIESGMLDLMRRQTSRGHIEELLDRIRAGVPGIALRTTFIVGFPGETEAQFETLLEFIAAQRFERLGIFQYSQEGGSRAGTMEGQIPPRVKRARYSRAMKLQQKIARETSELMIGRKVRVLIEKPLAGRTEADAPDVDCQVIFARPKTPGEFIDATITGSRVYDVLAD